MHLLLSRLWLVGNSLGCDYCLQVILRGFVAYLYFCKCFSNAVCQLVYLVYEVTAQCPGPHAALKLVHYSSYIALKSVLQMYVYFTSPSSDIFR